MTHIQFFQPDAFQLIGLLAVMAILAGFIAIGGALGGKNRFAAVDLFVGWGMASALFTLGGVFGGVPFTWLAAGLSVALVPAAMVIRKHLTDGGSYPGDVAVIWKILLLALPLLLIAATMKASQWDEFSHWLPNAQYIFRHDGFPGGAMAPITSAHPAYPYGLPIITYLASKLTGRFIENGSAIANVALHLALAPVYLSVVSRGLGQSSAWARQWGVAALGILGVTVLSTTFIQKLILTAYADATTSVVLAVAGVLIWKILDNLSEKSIEKYERTRSLAWQFAWVTVVLLSIKQSNLALFGLLLTGMVVVAIVDRKIMLIDIIRLMPIMVAPGVIVYLVWRYHVATYMPDGEHVILPFARWHLLDVWNILVNMFGVATDKGAFFLMMTAICLAGAYTLGKGHLQFARLGLITATVFIFFNLFLLFVYVGVFELSDSLKVISYWRFNTQLGLLGCTTAAYGVAMLWRRWGSPESSNPFVIRNLLPGVAVIAVVAAPLIAVEKLRFDIRPQKDHIRMVGLELTTLLPQGAHLKVIDPNGNGLTTTIIRYELVNALGADKNFSIPPGFDNDNNQTSSDNPVHDASITHAWVFQSNDRVKNAFGFPMPADASHLLAKEETNWRIIKSWPYTRFVDPYSLPD
ncbi:MAG: hypothetical protein HQ504_06440 [Rhodospirillaceae bacterium]|nr:hypothetical protein [Rhodospirillaceae bacterium]